MLDAVVLALADTLTPSFAARSGQKLTYVHKNVRLWWWYGHGAGATVLSPRAKSSPRV